MSAVARIAAFGALLLAIFAAAALAGDRIGWTPNEDQAAPAHDQGGGASHGAPATPPGLAVSEGGLTLDVDTTALPLRRPTELRFRILDGNGHPVRDFDVEHTKRMHLIVVRRDLTNFQHLHPTQRADGTWSTSVRLDEPGAYRVFADFSHNGTKRTLGADATVDGAAQARPLPSASRSTTVDGFRVTLEQGAIRANRESELRFHVTRDGRPVTPQTYLGARGHLVALREGDLAYLHVHPDANRLAFLATFPSASRYRLFLQFQVDGRAHTAALSQEAAS